ncbi:mechanosensitive ion channel domain-containing protein [Marinimicrococcus flavescens]|uniref:Mechanosensitive ion channel n=1 Tax=Marinimicrococcus flavescens TaxID=3031815 RepID=A0AAP3XQ37_9PROT|nr:mechanosensitive ion channel [Marinimicrococcus flavescens]
MPQPNAAEPAAQDALPAENLEALKATLENPEQREGLIRSIEALLELRREAAPVAPAEPQTVSAMLIDAAAETARQTRSTLAAATAYVGDLPRIGDWLSGLFADPAARDRGLVLLAYLGAILGAAAIAEAVARRLVRRPAHALDTGPGDSVALRLPLIGLRALLDLVPVVAFWTAGYATFVGLEPPFYEIRVIGLNLVNAYVTSRAVLVVARRLFAPRSPRLRILPLADDTARQLQHAASLFTNVAVGGYFLIEAGRLFGLPGSAAEALLRLLGLVLTTMAVIFILRRRAQVAQWLRESPMAVLPNGPLGQRLRRITATVWHLVAIVYVVLVYVVFAWRIENGGVYLLRSTVASLAVLVAGSLLFGLTERLLRRSLQPEPGAVPPRNGMRARLRGYLREALNGARLVLAAAMVLAILWIWGVDVGAWLTTPAVQQLLRILLTAGIAIGFGVVVWEALNAWIERYLTRLGDGDDRRSRAARARTVLPLLRKVVLGALSIVVGLVILSEIGIDIAPVLAGAGVIGLAVGFGSQKLVQDVITGVFLLLEDALAVGDVVTVAGIGGVVEDLSIRTIRLRDLSGAVHTIPFSSVDSVTNMTKDFSYYVASIGVAYREDTDEVARVCSGIVEEMRAEDAYRFDMLEPLEVLGVDALADSAVVVKARIKTRPGKQWGIGREFNRRMKKRFDELGIEIPFPHLTVYFGEAKDGTAPPAHLAVEKLPAGMALPAPREGG